LKMHKSSSLFIFPPLIAISLLALFPLVSLLAFSMFDVSVASGALSIKYVGVSAVHRVISDPQIGQVVLRSFFYVVGVSVLQLLIGAFVGLWIADLTPKAQRCALLIGVVLLVSPIAVSGLWRFLFAIDIGLINRILEILGIQQVRWLSQEPFFSQPNLITKTLFSGLSTGLLSAAIVEIWLWTPFVAIFVYMRAIAVPAAIREARNLDKLLFFQSFWGILFPHLSSIFATLFFIRIMETFRSFDIIWSFFGSSQATSTLAINAYATAQIEGDFSKSSIFSLMLVALSLSMLISAGLLLAGKEERD